MEITDAHWLMMGRLITAGEEMLLALGSVWESAAEVSPGVGVCIKDVAAWNHLCLTARGKLERAINEFRVE
jgi:hypothetical protein